MLPASGDNALWPPGRSTVEAACAGDDTARAAILSTGFRKLTAFYRGVGIEWTAAEDLASEACEGILRGLPRLRSPEAFESWFWAIGRNRLRTAFRRKTRIPRELDVPSPDGPEERTIIREEHRHIARALEKLSRRDREILWLREVIGLEYDQIGGHLGLSVGSARVAALRARRRLEEAYRAIEDHG